MEIVREPNLSEKPNSSKWSPELVKSGIPILLMSFQKRNQLPGFPGSSVILTMNQIEIYQAKDKEVEVKVILEEETVWLTQTQMAELFDKGRTTINEHIQNIFKESELEENMVCRKFRHTTQHGAIKGKTQETTVKYYNLDVIISVGYRVKSKRGTQFRQWATQRLKDYLVKGYSLNEKRLNQVLQNMQQLQQAVKLIQQSGNSGQLIMQSAKNAHSLRDYLKQFELFGKIEQFKNLVAYQFKFNNKSSTLRSLVIPSLK